MPELRHERFLPNPYPPYLLREGFTMAVLEASLKTGVRGKPSLRQHATGNWFYSSNGKNRYLGKDFVVAQALYFKEVYQSLAEAPKFAPKPLPSVFLLPLSTRTLLRRP